MKKINIGRKSIALILGVSLLCVGASCGSGRQRGEEYIEHLIVGFDSQEEILTKTMGQKEIREYKYVTDEKYVTQGTGALKVTEASEEDYNYMPTAMRISPSVYVFLEKTDFGKDLSDVISVAVDIYNPQSRPIEVKLYLETLIKEIEPAETIADTCYLLPDSMNHCVFELELDKLINVGIDNVQQMCFMLPIVQPNEEAITVYMDNLRFRTFKGEAVYNDQTPPAISTNGSVVSFEEKYFYNKTLTYTHYGSWLPSQSFTTVWCENPKYVSEGKRSLQIIAPCHGDVYRMERPYMQITLPQEYIEAYDFTKYTSATATLKLDVYFECITDNSDFGFRIYYMQENVAEMLWVKSQLKANQWTTINVPMNTGDGANADWGNVYKITFMIFQMKGSGNAVYYFDNLRVEE